jgi:hypothetical protein
MPLPKRYYPIRFYCACCSKSGTIPCHKGQKKVHIIHCQRCPLKPFICSECRRSKGKKSITHICQWCQTTGTLHSMHSLSCVNTSAITIDSWNYLRDKTASLARLPYLIRLILTNWCKFVESNQFVSDIRFVSFSCDLVSQRLRKNLFGTWVNSQLFQNVTSRNFRALFSETKISKRFLHMLKTVTFTRILVSNLFPDSPQKLLKSYQRFVLQYLLSNFANLSFC